MEKQVAIFVLSILAVMSFTASVAMALDCGCGDICVNETGWWCADGEFNPSGTPIQDAIDNADECGGEFSCADPCIICVTDGTYTENVDVTTSDLVIKSENGAASTTVNAADTSDNVFDVQADCITIDGFTISDATNAYGIYVSFGDSCTIKNNHITSNDDGIYVAGSGNLIIENNVIYDNVDYGIGEIGEVDGVATISGNEIYDNDYGIDFIEYIHGDLNICDNEIYGNDFDGIYYIEKVDGVTTISGNKIHENGEEGISWIGYIYNDLIICDNEIYGNDLAGIRQTFGVDGVTTISGNKIYENGDFGIESIAHICSDLIISNNEMYGNYRDGIRQISAVDGVTTILGNEICDNGASGIDEINYIASDLNICDNEIYGNYLAGICQIFDVEGVTTISGNKIYDNGDDGIDNIAYIYNGLNICDNEICGNGYDGIYYIADVDGVTTISGNKICDNAGEGINFIADIHNELNICDNEIHGNYGEGIDSIASVDGVTTISGNKIYDNEIRGIDIIQYIHGDLNICDNEIYCNGYEGIYGIEEVDGVTTISDNEIHNNDGHGIGTSADDTVISDNQIHDNAEGIWVNSDDNTIVRNMIERNPGDDTGVHLTVYADGNEINENCFIDNEQQAFDDGTGNNWDGNYWSPPPGGPDDYTIPGAAASEDSTPLLVCPLIPGENQPPIADANGPYVANEGTLIAFDASDSSDPDGDTLEYRWDFDDDGTWDTEWSGAPGASNTWFDDWTDTARVEVSDGEFTDDDTAQVTVLNVAPLVDAGPDQIVDEGELVSFSGSFTDPGSGDTHTYEWDFGDGGTSSGTLTPTHTYADNGDYIVSLTVTDDDGGESAGILTVTVNNVAPTVDAGPDQTVEEGDPVSFSGSFTDPGSGDTHTYKWDFGDGATASGTLTPTHTYADDGEYTVTLTVEDDDGGESSDILTVTVKNVKPTVDAGPDQTVEEGDPVSFDGSFTDPGSDDTHTYEWDFGDGATASGTLTPTHTYADDGDYTVTLTVEDDDGGVGTDTLAVTVNEGEVQQPYLCPDEYRWGDPAPGYSFAGWPTFKSWMDAHFVNYGPGDAYNVVASISYAPANVKIVDGYVTLGNIPAGSGAWSMDSFTLKVDMTNPQGPDESVKWTVEYDDAAGVHHVILGVPQFCMPE